MNKLFTYALCGNKTQPTCQDYFVTNNFLSSKITSCIKYLNSSSFSYGYNHYVVVPSQFPNLIDFNIGFIPAIQISCGTNKEPTSCLYIDATNNSYSDYSCNNDDITKSDCQNTFGKLNSTQNWKLLIELSTHFVSDLFQIFNYNISFNKVYTIPNVNSVNLSVYFDSSITEASSSSIYYLKSNPIQIFNNTGIFLKSRIETLK